MPRIAKARVHHRKAGHVTKAHKPTRRAKHMSRATARGMRLMMRSVTQARRGGV